MTFHFYSNSDAASHGVLSDACVCSDRSESGIQQWDALNKNAVRLVAVPPAINPPDSNDIPTTPESLPGFTTQPCPGGYSSVSDVVAQCKTIKAMVHAFAPTNPAILFSTPSAACNKLGAISGRLSNDEYFQFEGLTLISSSRTAEVYSQGEYVGTFRGEPMSTTTDTANAASSSSSSVALFKIEVGQEALPQKSRALLVKFFIPKKASRKPTDTPDALTLHWMVIHGSPLPSTCSSLTQMNAGVNTIETTAPNPPAPILQQFPVVPFSTFMPAMAMAATAGATRIGASPSGSTINLEKVRGMLGQVQLDSLPQGAKDLMKAMQMQAMSRGTAPSSADIQQTFTPRPVSADTAADEPKISELESVAAECSSRAEPSTFVTRSELAQMETRIKDMIDRRFQEMEQHIIDRILSSKN